MSIHDGSCHCGAIEICLETAPTSLGRTLGACQCSFCRKHNARTFTDPRAQVRIRVREPDELNCYTFGLRTATSIVCARCGVYVAMVLREGVRSWCTLNVDTLNDRELFTGCSEPRDFASETVTERIARRKQRWTPTELVDWPNGD